MRTTKYRCLLNACVALVLLVPVLPAAAGAPRLTRDQAVGSLNGIVVPLITPVKEDGAVDTKAMHALVDYLIGAGVDALFPCSVTGRFDLFSVNERRTIIATVVKSAAGRVPVFAGVDGETPAETLAQAKWAEGAGVDGVVVIPPGKRLRRRRRGRQRPSRQAFVASQQAVFEFCRRVHDAVGVYVVVHDTTYEKHSSPEIMPETYAKLAELPRIVGVKKATWDVSMFPLIRQACKGRLAIVCGNEFIFLGALSMGATGLVGGGANVYPQLLARVHHCFETGDLAGALKAQTAINQAARQLRQFRGSRTIALQGVGVPIIAEGRLHEDERERGDEHGRAAMHWRHEPTATERKEIQEFVRTLVGG